MRRVVPLWSALTFAALTAASAVLIYRWYLAQLAQSFRNGLSVMVVQRPEPVSRPPTQPVH